MISLIQPSRLPNDGNIMKAPTESILIQYDESVSTLGFRLSGFLLLSLMDRGLKQLVKESIKALKARRKIGSSK
jgi:hypothetical protein